jgi:hypothetical protein
MAHPDAMLDYPPAELGTDQMYFIEDLGSAWGAFLNGKSWES